jgi:hypothetical protein
MNAGKRNRSPQLAAALLLSLLSVGTSIADTPGSDPAKDSQNPIANLISVPFQNNINLNSGPEHGTQDVLNVQPVVPLALNANWNVITRTILPIVSNPSPAPNGNRTNGIGDVLFTAFLSPSHSNGWVWGVGPAIEAPTHSHENLGNDNWGLGPSIVVLHTEHSSPWVYGVLINNVWSVSASSARAYSKGLMQPFVDFNMPKGWYVVSSPIITANWSARGSQQWNVPIGGGVGKIVHWNKFPVNLQLQGFYNVVAPTDASNWQVRAQLQLLFPK